MVSPQRQQQPRILRERISLQLIGNDRGIDEQVDGANPQSPFPVHRQNKRNPVRGGQRVLDDLFVFLYSLIIQPADLPDIMDSERNRGADGIVDLQELAFIVGNNEAADVGVGAVNPEILLHRVEYIERIPGFGLR
ncbi:hypothetical protein D3C73_869620 [compost metagenome]